MAKTVYQRGRGTQKERTFSGPCRADQRRTPPLIHTEGLRKLGHRVWTPTQTGMGERAHLMSRQITVDTHIQDVTGVIEADELRDWD